MLEATINGLRYQFEPGISVLDACRFPGVEIPTLCHDERSPVRRFSSLEDPLIFKALHSDTVWQTRAQQSIFVGANDHACKFLREIVLHECGTTRRTRVCNFVKGFIYVLALAPLLSDSL